MTRSSGLGDLLMFGLIVGFLVYFLGGKRRTVAADQPPALFWLTPTDGVPLEALYESVIIFGAIGSGKTSGPAATITRALFRAGVGALCLTAKPTECERLRELAAECGRGEDFLRLAPDENTCDFLNVELAQPGATSSSAQQLLSVVSDVASRQSGSDGGDGRFWSKAEERTLQLAIAAVRGSHAGRCSVADLYAFFASCAQTAEQLKDARWQERSFFYGCFQQVLTGAALPADPDYTLAAVYFTQEFIRLSDRTRSTILTSVLATLAKFMVGPVPSMIASGTSTITPETIMNGAIVCVDLPILVWRETGIFVQLALKQLLVRALLRRDVRVSPLPVLLLQDEAQFMLSPTADSLAQSVSREARLITLSITQTLPGVVTCLGGSARAAEEAENWIAGHQLKILCQNGCKATNAFFSELCGTSRKLLFNGSGDLSAREPLDVLLGTPGRSSAGFAENWEPDIRPEAFTRLRKGTAVNRYEVDAICFGGGRVFANGKTWVKSTFSQRS